MLTQEVIKANAALANLTDEQIGTVVELSKNDEESVLKVRIGEIYGGIDKDFAEATGIPKNGTEKTYEYLKRVGKELTDKVKNVEGFETQINTLKGEKAKLEEAIKNGATDKEVAKKLEAVTTELTETKNLYNQLKGQFDEKETSYKNEMHGYRVDNEIKSGLNAAALKFKKELPKAVVDQLINTAIATLKNSYNQEFITDDKGNETMVFLDKKSGARIFNAENKLNPFTASEMITKELKALGILDESSGGKGAGSGGSGGSGGNDGVLDLSGARTREEAMELAHTALSQMGKIRGTVEYQKLMDQAWKDYKITELPLK